MARMRGSWSGVPVPMFGRPIGRAAFWTSSEPTPGLTSATCRRVSELCGGLLCAWILSAPFPRAVKVLGTRLSLPFASTAPGLRKPLRRRRALPFASGAAPWPIAWGSEAGAETLSGFSGIIAPRPFSS
eukprot:3967497-Alexandrium_andersonii.AAC.1